jgi:aspartate 1-decarboxylase
LQQTMLYAKFHRVTVTRALNPVGSVTIDRALLEDGRLLPDERLNVIYVTPSKRRTPHVIEGEAGSGLICINGAPAHLVQPGDIAIVEVINDPAVVPDGVGLEAFGTPREHQ